MINIFEKPKAADKKSKDNKRIYDKPIKEKLTLTGKSPEDVLPYLLSGEADDLSNDFYE